MVPIIISLSIILFFFVFLYVLYYMTFQNSPARYKRRRMTLPVKDKKQRAKIREIREKLQKAPCDEITITNREGKKLYGRYYHNRDNAPVALMFHGYRSKALSDCGGGYKICCELGVNVLIPDQRAHGESDGRAITFGIKERLDCLDWINYINENYNTPDIFLVGVSMGGATVLMASGEELPANVKGVISDCSYSSPQAIIRKVITDMNIIQRVVFPMVRLSGMIYGGFDICSYDAMQAVSKSKTPILLIHGEGDDFVPYSMAYDIKKNGDCQLLSVPKATHGLSYIYDTKKYTETVKKFIKNLS